MRPIAAYTCSPSFSCLPACLPQLCSSMSALKQARCPTPRLVAQASCHAGEPDCGLSVICAAAKSLVQEVAAAAEVCDLAATSSLPSAVRSVPGWDPASVGRIAVESLGGTACDGCGTEVAASQIVTALLSIKGHLRGSRCIARRLTHHAPCWSAIRILTLALSSQNEHGCCLKHTTCCHVATIITPLTLSFHGPSAHVQVLRGW
jgi:hypothetical protein